MRSLADGVSSPRREPEEPSLPRLAGVRAHRFRLRRRPADPHARASSLSVPKDHEAPLRHPGARSAILRVSSFTCATSSPSIATMTSPASRPAFVRGTVLDHARDESARLGR